MSCAAPSSVSRQLVVPGLAFSALTASLNGGGSVATVVEVVAGAVVEVDGAARGVAVPVLRNARAATTPTATTAAPPSAISCWRCRRRRSILR